jgi:uncharacterized protein (DUF1810 family)
MSHTTKNTLMDWAKILFPMLLTLTLAWVAHSKAVSALETRQDLTERRLNERITETTAHLERVDAAGSAPTKLNTEKLIYLTSRADKSEAAQAVTAIAIADMRSDIRVIADWVQEQRAAGRAAPQASRK